MYKLIASRRAKRGRLVDVNSRLVTCLHLHRSWWILVESEHVSDQVSAQVSAQVCDASSIIHQLFLHLVS